MSPVVTDIVAKVPEKVARPGKFGNNRIRMAGSVNQNLRFDLGARKLFFVPAPEIVLQQYRPRADEIQRSSACRLSGLDRKWPAHGKIDADGWGGHPRLARLGVDQKREQGA
jgi:hypothetical protein